MMELSMTDWKYDFHLPENGERLSKLKQCLTKIWAVNDQNDWPVQLNAVSYLFVQEFTMDFIDAIARLNRNRAGNLANLFQYPTVMFRMFDLLLKGMYACGLSSQERRSLILYFMENMEQTKEGSIFNETGANLRWSQKQLQNSIGYLQFLHQPNVSIEDARMIQRLIGLLKAYIELLYFRVYDIAQEIHGPYPIPEGNLVVYEFRNLKPDSLWNQRALLSCNQIKIQVVYSNQLQMTIDSYNHIRLQQGNFVQNLLGFQINVEDKPLDTAGSYKLLTELTDCISINRKLLGQLDWQEATKQYVDIFYYKIQPIFKAAEFQSNRYEDIMDRIEKGEPKVSRVNVLDEREIHLLLNLLI